MGFFSAGHEKADVADHGLKPFLVEDFQDRSIGVHGQYDALVSQSMGLLPQFAFPRRRSQKRPCDLSCIPVLDVPRLKGQV